MPRVTSSGRSPDWNRLYELAAPQGGYFTAAQAREAGYSLPLLQYYLRSERVERAARGIFRLVHFPTGEHDDLAVLWLWSGTRGVFSHETALMLHDLSDAMPAARHLTMPPAWSRRRLRVPAGVVLHYADLPTDTIAWHGPIPLTAPLRTLADCAADWVSTDLLDQAVTQGVRRGLFTRTEARRALGSAKRRGAA